MTGLGLADVLGAHYYHGLGWCGNGKGSTHPIPEGSPAVHRAHVAAAVTAWLAERLGSEGVREAVETAITNAWHSGDSDVTAALAAVVDALAGES